MTKEEVLEFCKKLRQEFPAGFMRIEECDRVKSYPWRDSPAMLADRFQKLSDYMGFTLGEDFTPEEAIEATKAYVKSFGDDYQNSGMRTQKYFIFKKTRDEDGSVDYVSDLMTMIWLVRDGVDVGNMRKNKDWTTQIV